MLSRSFEGLPYHLVQHVLHHRVLFLSRGIRYPERSRTSVREGLVLVAKYDSKVRVGDGPAEAFDVAPSNPRGQPSIPGKLCLEELFIRVV